MRSAQVLKCFAYAVMVLGIFFAVMLSDPLSLKFWMVITVSFLLWLVLRLFAIMTQLIYELRNDSLRMLGNIERALHYSNSLVQEIRDLAETVRADKKANEDIIS